MPHPPIRQLLLEFIPLFLNPLARSLNIIHTNTNMPEPPSRISIAVRDLEIRIVFRAVVVRQLQHPLTVCPVGVRVGVVGEEVEVEFVVWEGDFVNLAQAEKFIVFDWILSGNRSLCSEPVKLACLIPWDP